MSFYHPNILKSARTNPATIIRPKKQTILMIAEILCSRSVTINPLLDQEPGLEPRLTESESVVLPIKLFLNGADRRNRTLDLMLTRQLLYRLSYTSVIDKR